MGVVDGTIPSFSYHISHIFSKKFKQILTLKVLVRKNWEIYHRDRI